MVGGWREVVRIVGGACIWCCDNFNSVLKPASTLAQEDFVQRKKSSDSDNRDSKHCLDSLSCYTARLTQKIRVNSMIVTVTRPTL